MLDESSTTTATMFCCGRSVATLNAGCQIINSSTLASSVCNSHTTAERGPLTRAVVDWLMKYASTPPTARIAIPSSHKGQPPASTRVPFENIEAGYLKKNSNISGTNHTQNNSWQFDTPAMRTFPDRSVRPSFPMRLPGPYCDRLPPSRGPYHRRSLPSAERIRRTRTCGAEDTSIASPEPEIYPPDHIRRGRWDLCYPN